jgi:hypothetical protein
VRKYGPTVGPYVPPVVPAPHVRLKNPRYSDPAILEIKSGVVGNTVWMGGALHKHIISNLNHNFDRLCE